MLDFLNRSCIGEEFHHFYLECYHFYFDHHLDLSGLSFHTFLHLCVELYFAEEFDSDFLRLNNTDSNN